MIWPFDQVTLIKHATMTYSARLQNVAVQTIIVTPKCHIGIAEDHKG